VTTKVMIEDRVVLLIGSALALAAMALGMMLLGFL
jgi:hypothetical protein